MKFFKLLILLTLISAQAFSQCSLTACENLPATITANVTAPPAGETYSYNWTLGLPFTGQSTDVISIADVGTAINSYPFTLEVTNDVTGCVAIYNCNLDVNTSTPISFNIPPYCENDPSFDLTPFAPIGTTFSGAAVTGSIYDTSIGGPVVATPQAGSAGCLTDNTQTPTVNPLPVIISTVITQ